MKNDVLKVIGAFLLLFLVFLLGSISTLPAVGRNASKVVTSDNSVVELSLKDKGIQWSPDAHISYITLSDGNRRYFISGNQRSYAINAAKNQTLENAIKSGASPIPVYGPDPLSGYKNNYAVIAQVLQTDASNPNHVFALTQYEQQARKSDGTFDYSNFTASIGLLESLDGGLSWRDFGPVIRGDDYLAPGTRISGAGEPSAVIKDGYVYIYYVDWAAQVKVFHGDQIYLARTHIESNGGLSALEFYTVNGFSTTEANLQPVVTQPTGNSGYVSLPSVSFNKYMGSLIMIFETNQGFYSTVSYDGITWTNSKKIFDFPQPQSERKEGNVWYSYPTLLSDQSESSDQTTQKTGNLYFSRGIWPNTAHQPAKTTFNLQ